MTSAAKAQIEGTDLAMRFLRGEDFNSLYRNVMSFVQETAEYLDGPGRAQSKNLSRASAKDYVILTRQLTTGTMRIANILLTLRAAKNGDIPFTRAMSDIRDKDMSASVEGFMGTLEGLPQELLELVARCEDLRVEAARLVESLGKEGRAGANPVHSAIDLIGKAFGTA